MQKIAAYTLLPTECNQSLADCMESAAEWRVSSAGHRGGSAGEELKVAEPWSQAARDLSKLTDRLERRPV